jgi:hypothetical protein
MRKFVLIFLLTGLAFTACVKKDAKCKADHKKGKKKHIGWQY